MLHRYPRAFFTKVFTPVAKLFLRLGISPAVVTIVGTLGVCAGALAFYPRNEFFVGTLVITAFVFSDTIDGVMARMSGRSGKWGAYLDSTLDRLGEGEPGRAAGDHPGGVRALSRAGPAPRPPRGR